MARVRSNDKAARIVLNPFGSLGDLHPYLALALELAKRGHLPLIATSELYRAKVQALGLEFAPVRPDVGELRDDPEFLAKLWHPKRGTEFLVRDYLLPRLADSHADLLRACSGADLLLTHAIAYAGPIVAEQLSLRWLSVALQPLLFLSPSDRPALTPLPVLQTWRAPPSLYRAIFFLGRLISRRWAAPIHELRKRAGLSRFRGNPLLDARFSPYGTLALFSRHYAQPQPDWPPKVTLCGFPFYDQLGTESADTPALQQFMAAGDAPILFTLGSSAVLQAGSFYEESLRALKGLPYRAVLLTGPEDSGKVRTDVPANVHFASYAPYSELMPRCRAIVHQGGIGTTAQALRSGRPMIVVPWSHDQPDNARHIVQLGAGRTLPRRHYRADNIRRELERLLANDSYANRARQLGSQIQTENGPAAACDAIEQALR